MKYFLIGYFFLFCLSSHAQDNPRTVVNINNGWQFFKGTTTDNATWQTVTIPHTWNVEDVSDDEPGYYRGVGWYKRKLHVPASDKTRKTFLYFEGASQVTEVWVNGKKTGDHTGGYTSFYIPIDTYLKYGDQEDNEILIKVDNSYDKNIPPLSADFTFYGGIYRDIYLVTTGTTYFDDMRYGGSGVLITTPEVSHAKAKVNIAGYISNASQQKNIRIVSTIYDKDKKQVAVARTSRVVKKELRAHFSQEINEVLQPQLWSPENPYLYSVVTRIYDESSDRLLDEMINPLGFRWFRFDAATGFFLNGKPYKLIGASRHQDYQGLGNAVPNELAIKDVQLLKEMGGNFLRIAHYPQDPVIAKACDELGILASVEIPVVNEITESDSFYHHCMEMQVEMIRQHFNHPSVIIWCHMNEILLRPHFTNDKERQKIYFAAIRKLAAALDSITRKEDPSRYTMIVNHGDYQKYKDVGLVDIPMISGWNLYSGWYGNNIKEFPVFLDKYAAAMPAKPMMVTEYGADADPRIHSTKPVRFDKSVEYTTSFHQYYLQEMMKRPFVAGAIIWNLADFNSETRAESMPHINNKGLLEWNRTPKDPYYFYQSFLRKEPILKILGTGWQRTGMADSNARSCQQQVQVTGNTDSVELTLNGKRIGQQKMSDGLVAWDLPLIDGDNRIEVSGKKNGITIVDQAIIHVQLQPRQLRDATLVFQQMNILLGAKRYFESTTTKETWLPDQPYQPGSWGSIGGKPFKIPSNTRLPYGTDRNITNTYDDPIYQTQQVGIEKYRFDVTAGEYELTFHFAELVGGTIKGLAYNLDAADRKEQSGKRIFSVLINGKMVLENINLAEQYGAGIAVEKKIQCTVNNEDGIEIVFQPVAGEPVLNALQLKKIK